MHVASATNEAEAAIVRPWRACLAFAATVALPLTAVIGFVPRHQGIVIREGPALGPSLRLVFQQEDLTCTCVCVKEPY